MILFSLCVTACEFICLWPLKCFEAKPNHIIEYAQLNVCLCVCVSVVTRFVVNGLDLQLKNAIELWRKLCICFSLCQLQNIIACSSLVNLITKFYNSLSVAHCVSSVYDNMVFGYTSTPFFNIFSFKKKNFVRSSRLFVRVRFRQTSIHLIYIYICFLNNLERNEAENSTEKIFNEKGQATTTMS